jgi:hypothetical protein
MSVTWESMKSIFGLLGGGGYYNVHDRVENIYRHTGTTWEVVERDVKHDAEWPDRWGVRVGDLGTVPEDQLYLQPAEEEMQKIRQQYRDRQSL